MNISNLFTGWFSQTSEHLGLPQSAIPAQTDLLVGGQDDCLNTLSDLCAKRANIINGLRAAFLNFPLATIDAYKKEVKAVLEQSEALRELAIYCLQKYIDAKPGTANNAALHAENWAKHRELSTNEASVISQALENDWVAPPVPPRPKPTPKPEKTTFWKLATSILKDAIEIPFPLGIVAAATGYYYDKENIWALPLLATATLAQLGSYYFSKSDPITMQSLANGALALTETWFEHGSLTGIPASVLAAWVSNTCEQLPSTNLAWAVTAYTVHFGLAKLIAASRA